MSLNSSCFLNGGIKDGFFDMSVDLQFRVNFIEEPFAVACFAAFADPPETALSPFDDPV
jgi:hypothetical protein